MEDLHKALYDEMEEARNAIEEKMDSLSKFVKRNRKEILAMKLGPEMYSALLHRGQLLVAYLAAIRSEKTVLSLEQTDDYPKSESWN